MRWQCTDAGSGVQDFSIYVSDNGGLFVPWLTHSGATQAVFAGSAKHKYGFYSIARDWAGNQERSKTVAAETTKVVPAYGDLDGDGKVNCGDLNVIRASFGKRAGQPGFDARADVDLNGVVDLRDLWWVVQRLVLPPGDLNGDGKIDCSDVDVVKASFGKRSGQPGFDAQADVNLDAVVDVRDLSWVSQKLPAGTTCP